MRRKVTLLTYDRTGALASKIRERLGYQIRVLHRSGMGEEATITEEDLARVVAQVGSAPAPSVMLIAIEGKFVAVPYQEE
jgi:hypothetical protein